MVVFFACQLIVIGDAYDYDGGSALSRPISIRAIRRGFSFGRGFGLQTARGFGKRGMEDGMRVAADGQMKEPLRLLSRFGEAPQMSEFYGAPRAHFIADIANAQNRPASWASGLDTKNPMESMR
ncbi:hypothetical protein BV898_15258 [Hypsibius exemplaris]|uniref:Uncharacterized protein n=1 Tax=Hypsibius exemplaris TaxID=2072580 RepID=A0A9X6RKB6_HYPEX|nr:hypothetical protein BV898_15258 [Hypsibius exemplaris]